MRAGLPYVVEDSEADGRILEDDRAAYVLTSIRAIRAPSQIQIGIACVHVDNSLLELHTSLRFAVVT